MRNLAFILLFLACLCPATTKAVEKAWYGFHIKPALEGFALNPVVKSVVIDKVKANSPASAQNIRVGDEIIEAEGIKVPGTRALQFVPILRKQPGDTLNLRLKTQQGRTYSVLVQAIQRPSS